MTTPLVVRGLPKLHKGPWSIGQLTGGLFFGHAAAASAQLKMGANEPTEDSRANLSSADDTLGWA